MLLLQLKDQTREHHTRLEALIALPRSKQELMLQLETFFGFVEPWERALAKVLRPDDPILDGRQKTSWLEADLEFLGVNSGQRQLIPRATELPSLASRVEVLGAAYVLEGSTLGGTHIARHLEDCLGLRDGCGYRYFRSYGPRVGSMWQAFRAELSAASSPTNDPLIVAAARQTFELLHRWFAIRLAYGNSPSVAPGPS